MHIAKGHRRKREHARIAKTSYMKQARVDRERNKFGLRNRSRRGEGSGSLRQVIKTPASQSKE